MQRARGDRPGAVPVLSPDAEAVRLLSQMPVERLRAAAEQRAIEVAPRATRPQIARLLVRHAARARDDAEYRETGVAFDSRDAAYPPLRRLVTRYRLHRILDIGCGPGLFADQLRRALPGGGRYIGVDVSSAAIELARTRLDGDPRFAFHIGDAEQLGGPAASAPALAEAIGGSIDGVVASFVLSYLDTRAVDRLIDRLVLRWPRATLIVALTFRSCVDRHDGVEPDEARELRAARRYLAGHIAGADALWDLRRLVHYRASVEARYRIVEQRTLRPLAQMLWLGRPRRRRAVRPRARSVS